MPHNHIDNNPADTRHPAVPFDWLTDGGHRDPLFGLNTRHGRKHTARAAACLAFRAAAVALNVGLIAGTAYVLGARVTDAPTAILAFIAVTFGLSGGFLPPRGWVVNTEPVHAVPHPRHFKEHHIHTSGGGTP